jgi:hypothetical protein
LRNATITIGAALTLLALTPAHATGLCSNFPSLDRCPIYGVYDTTPYQSSESTWQTAPRRVRHTQARELRYFRQG